MNFLSKFALITLFSLSSFSGKVLAYEYRSEAELGYQSALRVSDQEFTVSKLYFQYKGDSNLTGGSIETPFEAKISGSLRSWVDTQFSEPAGTARYTFERNTQNWGGEVEIRSLSLSLSQTLWKLQTGFQEIAWGETFGFQIVDLVNPRDYSDPLILDPSWSRLPVFTLNGQLFLDRLTLQGIFTPVPRNNKFPAFGSRFDPTLNDPVLQVQNPMAFKFSDFAKEAEFGMKANYLFDSGLDLSAFYFHHWSRSLLYEFSSPSTIAPVVEPVQSIGSTLSASSGPWVLRNDSILNWDQPLTGKTFGSVIRKRSQFQDILGADFTTPQGWILGTQYHTEMNFYGDQNIYMNWASAKVSAKFFSDKLEPEIFIFQGLGNMDQWVQPKLTWYPTGNWSASLRSDLIAGDPTPRRGYLGPLRNQNRLFLWLSCKI